MEEKDLTLTNYLLFQYNYINIYIYLQENMNFKLFAQCRKQILLLMCGQPKDYSGLKWITVGMH